MCRSARRASDRSGFFVADDCHPQTIAVVERRGRAARHRDRGRRPPRSSSSRPRILRRARAVPDHRRRVVRLHGARRAGARRGRAGRRRGRSCSRSTLLTPPGELGADIAVGSPSASACRWATAARTPRSSRRARSTSASCPGRIVGVSKDADGKPRAPPGAADARAAHPPREGDLQHLHRAGAARGHGRHVRVYHGPEGLRADRRARARA